MLDTYLFVSGPLAWAAFIIFAAGLVWRLVSMALLARKKDNFVYDYFSLRHALRSLAHWYVPFATESMRGRPEMTLVSFAFHICLLVAPIFLLGHVALIEDNFGLSWPVLPDMTADIMTLIVIFACVFFLVRRLTVPEARYVTSASDFVILALVAAPFVTGFLAYLQVGDYMLMLTLHILAGEAMLVAIPFTRLSHMVFAPLSRAYIGSEFGAVRHARDW